ncbi:Ldh family oxidoreductase, partial [Rhizobium ruizarguesonis]|uniref:Ldh family oxidoreductase n=1 Tax=Rhizobium ruizarguesonis TaxID=2081791 RepID=UPI0010D245DC
DNQGQPTTEPKAALEGFLLPVGGHKGYGLALVVDLFAGVLSGAAYLSHVKSWVDAPGEPQNLGHFFLVIDTTRLGQKSWLAERMNDFADILHSTPATNPDAPVLLPGEIEMRNLARQRKTGIAIDNGLLAKIREYAGRGAPVGDKAAG